MQLKVVKATVFRTVIGIVILFGITGCADSGSGSQTDTSSESTSQVSEALSMDETEQVNSGEVIPEEGVLEPEEGGEAPSSVIPAVMIDGTIYYLSQGPTLSDQEVDDSPAGYTESEVSLNVFPKKDGESNYAPAGTPYVKYENGYALKVDQYGWTLFLTWEDRSLEK